jgi:hypothetical protein
MLLHVARQSFDVGQATDVTHVKVGTHQNHLTLAIAAVRLAHRFATRRQLMPRRSNS